MCISLESPHSFQTTDPSPSLKIPFVCKVTSSRFPSFSIFPVNFSKSCNTVSGHKLTIFSFLLCALYLLNNGPMNNLLSSVSSIARTLFLLSYGHLELLYFLILTSKVYLSVYNVFFLKYLFIYLAPLGLSCSVWNLVPQPRIKLRPPTLRAWSLSHWTAKEVPVHNFLYWLPLPIVLGFSREVESVEYVEGWMDREREIYF